MNNTQESLIKDRIQQLKDHSYIPENVAEKLIEIGKKLGDQKDLKVSIAEIQDLWQDELLESYVCVDKLQNTILQYEDELVLMMDQMDALVKCSLLIKQYSLYLKEEIEKISDKIDRQGLDERIDQLVGLLEEIKPKRHLNLVRDTEIIEFPKKK
ncbi:MAG: hypothetical protein AB1782_09125 [Cyanobacteriota bacterium]